MAAVVLAGALVQAQAGNTDDQGYPTRPATSQGPADSGPREGGAVRDLVLDPEGNVLVAYAGERGIWKIDLAGHLALHALLPEGGDGEIRSMTLDPASGDLHVREASTAWRVTPGGEVTPMDGELPEAPAESKLEARPRPPRPGPRRGGLLCMTLLGLGALADPLVLGAAAPFDLTPASNRYTADATAGLGRLDPVCAASLLSGKPVAPCVGSYRSRVLAQVNDIDGQMRGLFVDPAILGPGRCLPGESLKGAKSRIALDQGDTLAEFDALSADANAFMMQMNRDGQALEAVGKPGALSELTGLRAFLRRELSHAAEELATKLQPA